MTGSSGLSFPTSLGTSSADEIRLLGHDLTADLMGKVSFGELAFWLVALCRPTPSETRVFEAVLVALADHGFTPTAIAARITYLSALGAHPFLTLTLFIAMFERDYGPLEYQRAYVRAMAHIQLPYPDIAT